MSASSLPAGGPAGIPHAELGRRSRRLGAWRVVEHRFRAEVPFLSTFLLTAVGNPFAYLAAMGIGLGSLVTSQVAGVPYLTFVAPALLVSTVATTGSGWGSWPVLSGFKWERSYIAAGASSVTPQQIATGEAIAAAIRLLLQGLLFWLIGWAFGAWRDAASLLVVPIAALAGMAFYAPLAAYAATVKDEGLTFQVIQRLVVMPMFLFAGTFFPLESLPVYLRWVGWLSPMWHGTQLARVAAFGMAYPWWGVLGHLAALITIVTVGMALARRTHARRLMS